MRPEWVELAASVIGLAIAIRVIIGVMFRKPEKWEGK